MKTEIVPLDMCSKGWIKRANNVPSSNDSEKVIALVTRVDQSAAFDTIDNKILLNRLVADVGVTVIALHGFRSYLSDCTQVVSCPDPLSSSRPVICGVPWGSVLGLLLFCIYTRPLEQIIERHKWSITSIQMTHSFICRSNSAMPNLPWLG